MQRSNLTLEQLENIRKENRAAARAMAGHWLLDPQEEVSPGRAAAELGFTRAALNLWNVPEQWAVRSTPSLNGPRRKFRREDIYALALASGEAHRPYQPGSSSCAGRRINLYTTFLRKSGRADELPTPQWFIGHPARRAVPA